MAGRRGQSQSSGASGGAYNFDKDNRCIVYTDGACLNNGREGARAGVGVYFGEGNKHNVSEPLRGSSRPTNNNAEIQAAARACEAAKQANIEKVNIHTDSKFLIQSAKEWMPNWENNGWRTASNKPVENRQQFEALKKSMEGMDVEWTHVPGHSNNHGNEMSDRLAKSGAEYYEG